MIDIFQISKREEFSKLLISMGLKGFGIEIGVAQANFSETLIKSGLSKIYLLDAWKEFKDGYFDINNVSQAEQDNRYSFVIEKMRRHGKRVVVIRDDCDNAVKSMDDGFFDFIYLDANHKFDAVYKNILDWYTKLKSNGVLAGHDYLNGTIDGTEFGVKSAVDDFVKKNNVKLFVTSNDTAYKTSNGSTIRYPSWYFQKP